MEPALGVDPRGRGLGVPVVVRHPRDAAVQELPHLVRAALPPGLRVADRRLHPGQRHPARPGARLGRVVDRADAAEPGRLRPAQARDLHRGGQPRLHRRHPLRPGPTLITVRRAGTAAGSNSGWSSTGSQIVSNAGTRRVARSSTSCRQATSGRERPDVDERACRRERAHEQVDPAAVVQRQRRPEPVVRGQAQALDEVLARARRRRRGCGRSRAGARSSRTCRAGSSGRPGRRPPPARRPGRRPARRASTAPAPASARSSGDATTTAGSASSRSQAVSSGVPRGLTGAGTAPSIVAATTPTTASRPPGSTNSTRSPRRTPRACSPAACARAAARTAGQVARSAGEGDLGRRRPCDGVVEEPRQRRPHAPNPSICGVVSGEITRLAIFQPSAVRR